jgi:hypothetical protein
MPISSALTKLFDLEDPVTLAAMDLVADAAWMRRARCLPGLLG